MSNREWRVFFLERDGDGAKWLMDYLSCGYDSLVGRSGEYVRYSDIHSVILGKATDQMKNACATQHKPDAFFFSIMRHDGCSLDFEVRRPEDRDEIVLAMASASRDCAGPRARPPLCCGELKVPELVNVMIEEIGSNPPSSQQFPRSPRKEVSSFGDGPAGREPMRGPSGHVSHGQSGPASRGHSGPASRGPSGRVSRHPSIPASHGQSSRHPSGSASRHRSMLASRRQSGPASRGQSGPASRGRSGAASRSRTGATSRSRTRPGTRKESMRSVRSQQRSDPNGSQSFSQSECNESPNHSPSQSRSKSRNKSKRSERAASRRRSSATEDNADSEVKRKKQELEEAESRVSQQAEKKEADAKKRKKMMPDELLWIQDVETLYWHKASK